MLITPAELRAQFERARLVWPFLASVERAHGVPALLLAAVGSRETNLTNEHGDGGHGHGVFQLDDRWHHIPAGFDDDVQAQAETAAAMLHDNLGHFHGEVLPAVCAYNAGIGNVALAILNHGDPDYFTTHSNGVGYGVEVLARWHYLTSHYGSIRQTSGKPRPWPSWYHRELAYPCPLLDAGRTAHTVIGGRAARVQAGADVRHVQALARVPADSLYGPETAAGVARWQRRNGLLADGIFGPACAQFANAHQATA